MPSYFIGIDIGTGSLKAVAMTTQGEVLASSKQHYPLLQPQPGYSEQDPYPIYQAFIKAVAKAIQQSGGTPAAISLSSAMHSIIPVDEHGNALHPMITWADTRSEQIAHTIRNSNDGEWIYRTSGTPIHPMSPLCKLIWLKERRLEIFRQAHKFISIKEYIWFRLFGVFEIDYGIASATGLFDIHQLTWSEKICNYAGISMDKLSTVVNTTYIRSDIKNDVAERLHIPASTPFIIGSSDGCCANLGSLAIAPGIAALTIGTSGAVRVTGKKPIVHYDSMIFNYLLNADTFVSGGAVNNGGIVVNWLLSSFLDETGIDGKDYERFFNAVETIPAGSDGLVFLPYLYGERAPIWDAGASGAYFNIKPVHSRAHFLRAALEGVCFALNNVLETLETSAQIKQLNVSGGFVNSPVWMQLLADITGKNLVMLQLEDASAVGAIYLAMQTLQPETEIALPEHITVVEPDKTRHQLYVKIFPIFKKLYRDTRDTMHQLNQING